MHNALRLNERIRSLIYQFLIHLDPLIHGLNHPHLFFLYLVEYILFNETYKSLLLFTSSI